MNYDAPELQDGADDDLCWSPRLTCRHFVSSSYLPQLQQQQQQHLPRQLPPQQRNPYPVQQVNQFQGKRRFYGVVWEGEGEGTPSLGPVRQPCHPNSVYSVEHVIVYLFSTGLFVHAGYSPFVT